jgi:hypothetical protein
MVSEIRIYVEGGDRADSEIRRGFSEFLRDLKAQARSKGIRWYIIAGRGRETTFDLFKTAIALHRNAFNILLVDSEGPVSGTPWQHLRQRDNWEKPHGVCDEQCHLMVQSMETWLIADLDTLRRYYGPEFIVKQIFRNANVEHIDRHDLAKALTEATKRTKKGPYRKIQHASELLAQVDVSTIHRKASYCERLFATLMKMMD